MSTVLDSSNHGMECCPSCGQALSAALRIVVLHGQELSTQEIAAAVGVTVRRVGQVRSQASPWFSALQGDFDRVDYNGDVIATGVAGGDSAWSPAWPFMAGGSYTTFAVGSVSAGVSADGARLVASANVSNTGAWPGKLVLGLFFSRPLSALVRSHLALAAFAKSELLAPGAWGTLTMSAPLSALASYDPASRLDVVEPGQYELSVRTDSESVVPGGTFLVTV